MWRVTYSFFTFPFSSPSTIISLFQIYYLFYNSHKQLCLLGLRFRCTFHCLFAFLEIINCITSAVHALKAKVNISSSNYARLTLIQFQCVRHKYSPIFLLPQFVTVRVPLLLFVTSDQWKDKTIFFSWLMGN